MCGCLTLTIVSALEYLALPIQLSIFVGGIVGFKGTLWVDRIISKKVGEES
ncbi:phage holin family protein [Acinetobacter beijerinckii]|uniref:phage holin family protein n=1 Tax=Acinetobacter beijerinckii TaxID=262668 RepID=UPI003AF4C0B1